MSALIWDKVGERLFETGVDRGVLYPYKQEAYQKGVVWNGLTNVNESPSGAEATPLWADNIKYLNLMSAEEFGATIEAYMYPDEFAECDGSAEIAPGVTIGQQKRKMFGFSYRTKIGSDTEGNDKGYKIHLVYGALASPSDKSYGTINDSPEAITFSWTVTTTPVNVTGFKPTAHLVIDSTKVNDAAKMKAIEDVLYGTAVTDARLPLPDEVAEIITGNVGGSIELDTHAVTIKVGDTVTLGVTKYPADAVVTFSSASTSVAEVTSGGVVSGDGTGNTIITAAITVEGVTYTDTCTVIVEAASEG